MVSQIYPSELQLNKANTFVNEAAFLDDFDFEIVYFPCLDGDIPRSTSYGDYNSQLIRFARASSHVTDFNTRN